MNAPIPSSRQHGASPAETAVHEHAVNPLWMITAALALFLAAMAILIAAS